VNTGQQAVRGHCGTLAYATPTIGQLEITHTV